MSRYALRSTLAGLSMALAAGLASPVNATPGDAPTVAGAMHKGHHGSHGVAPDKGVMLPGLGPLSQEQLEQLKLDAKQQEQVKTAQTAAQELRTSMRDSGKTRHDLVGEQLKNDKLDPRALIEHSNKERDQLRQRMIQVQANWLAVWDSLNDTQRKQVTEFVKERHAKMQAHQGKRHERGGRGG